VHETFCDQDEASIFLGELMDTGNPAAMPPAQRAKALPVLWQYRRPFSLEHFSKSLTLQDPEGTHFPVLSQFLQDEDQLAMLRYIPGVFEWTSLLLKRYNHRIGREEAQVMTMGDVLEEMEGTGNAKAVREAYEAYRAAFNGSLTYMDRFGCTPIPAMWKATKVTAELPISFALVGRENENLLPLALIQWMCNKHNELVQRIDEVLLLRQKESQRYAGSDRNLSSRFFTRANAITYQMELVLPVVEKQCVAYTASNDIQYDFKKAEDWLIDRFLTSKPVIDVELREFEYPGDSVIAKREILQGKIAQEALSPDVEDDIRNELSTAARAARSLRAAEMCVSFITASSAELHSTVGEKILEEYVHDTLLIEGDVLQSRVISKDIKLKHLDALCELLDELASPNPFDKINQFFKKPLSDKHHAMLLAACPKMDLTVLVPTLFKFIRERVRTANETHAPIGGPAGWLAYAETDAGEFLSELPWFEDFPDAITMPNIIAVYTALRNVA